MKAPKDLEEEIPDTWETVEPFPGFSKQDRFIPHTSPDGRLLLRYFLDRRDKTLKARAWFGPGAGGAPGRIHGGSVSAILDEVLGAAIWMAGLPVVTVRLTIKYRRPLKIGSICVIATNITKMGSRRVNVEGTLSVVGGDLIANAEGTYFRLPPADVGKETEAIMAQRRADRAAR